MAAKKPYIRIDINYYSWYSAVMQLLYNLYQSQIRIDMIHVNTASLTELHHYGTVCSALSNFEMQKLTVYFGVDAHTV